MKRFFSVLLCAIMLVSTVFVPGMTAAASQQNPDSYYSEDNAPVLYGAGEISIPVGTPFSVSDSRFRVFATDFEDDDLSQDIVSEGTVNSDKAGDYSVSYSVTDSHGNVSTLTVPVHVLADTDKITVKRIMYTLPSMWNVDMCGFYRGSRSDRQILGITLPAGESFEIKAIDAGEDLLVSCFANDSKTESSFTVKNDGSLITVKNTKDGTDYSSVPLIRTLIMPKGTALGKTSTIEISYDAGIPALNYYRIGDDEQSFRDKWNAEKNVFGVLECSAALFVLPYNDLKYSVGYYTGAGGNFGFSSLDDFLQYFIDFTAKMDEYVGLELDPIDPLNQNVRTKYTVKANASGGGSAYYGTDHVGIHSPSMGAIFSYGWGTLHEFAHGYQGSLGRGDLSEVSNNILGHYIQLDKSIYKAPGDWLGDYAKNEDAFNKVRLEGNTDVKVKLYSICKLFDAFDGPQTYAKVFSFYRQELSEGRTPDKYDAYAEAIAKEYGVNIIPYLSAWGVTNSSETAEMINQMQLPTLNILADTVGGDTLAEIMQSEGINEKYELVGNDVFEKYCVNGSLTVNVSIDDPSAVQGKTAVLRDKTGTVSKALVTDGKAVFTGVPVGTYTLNMPVIGGYRSGIIFVTVTQNGSSVSFGYTKKPPITDSERLCLRGMYNTYGYTVSFNSDYSKATVTLGAANMSGSNSYAKIFDADGKLISEENRTLNNGANYDFYKAAYTVDTAPGYVIEVFHSYADRVHVLSNNTGERIAALNAPANGVTRYVVTANGLRLLSQTDKDAEEISYNLVKSQAVKLLEDYAASAADAELGNKYVNTETKSRVINAWSSLNDADKAPYSQLIERIEKGGSPQISIKEDLSFPYGRKVNLYTLIKVYDNEDGLITPDGSCVKISGGIEPGKLGLQHVVYTVWDSDGNTSELAADINIYEAGHQPVTVPGKAPTCTEAGYTESSHCALCGKTLSESQVIPAKGHADNNGDGVCDECGAKLNDSSDDGYGFSFSLNFKGFFSRIWSFIRSLFSRLFFC